MFLPIVQNGGEALCPYCGTRYKLVGEVRATTDPVSQRVERRWRAGKEGVAQPHLLL